MSRVAWFFLLILGLVPQEKIMAKVTERLLRIPHNQTTKKDWLKQPKLYGVDSDDLVQGSKDGFLPERVYAVFNEKQQAWFFALTSPGRKFPEPMEILYFKTVLSGRYLGAKNPYQNYKLNEAQKWAPTKEPEIYYFWVLGNPQLIKKVQFIIPYQP